MSGDYIFTEQNNYVLIKMYDDIGIITNIYEYEIKYIIMNEINEKKYYIDTTIGDEIELSTINFFLILPLDTRYTFTFYEDDIIKSLIIYKEIINLPLIFLGLPNLTKEMSIIINYGYEGYDNMGKIDGSGNYILTMFNNYDGNFNHIENNILKLNGNYNKIIISNTNGIYDSNPLNIYKIYGLNSMNIITKPNTNIYFYQQTSLFSSIIYLNNYNFTNFVDAPNYTEKYSNIIVLIEYIDSSGNIYSSFELNNLNNQSMQSKFVDDECYCVEQPINTNTDSTTTFYVIEDDEKIPIEFDINKPIRYSCVSTLNMQTLNLNQLENVDFNEYYNMIFFYNYVNPNYYVKSIRFFCDDFEKYFINYEPVLEPKKQPVFNNIGLIYNDLYDVLIENDTELKKPLIIELNYPLAYYIQNIDLINIVNMINFNFENNFMADLLKSKKNIIETIVNYLANYKIIKYNVYKIINVYKNETTNLSFSNSYKINNDFEPKTNYNYDNTPNRPNDLNKNFNYKINFNNNIMNCVRCHIFFIFTNNTFYTFDAKLFIDNYSIAIYNKKYDFDNNIDDTNKKKFLNMLIYLCTKTISIKLIFYANNIYTNNINPNPYSKYNGPYEILYNQINFYKTSLSKDDFNLFLDISGDKNNYKTARLNLNMTFKKDYYILFLYADANTFLSNYDELKFVFDKYLFKINKIKTPNANLYEDKLLFYISFNDIYEINSFMNYIKTLKLEYPKNISNYFNFKKSKTFVCYYELNDYWIYNKIDDNMPKHQIYFSINNLEIKQIYLYGNLFIQTI